MSKGKQLIDKFCEAQDFVEEQLVEFLGSANNRSLNMMTDDAFDNLYQKGVTSKLERANAPKDKLFTFEQTGQVTKTTTVVASCEEEARDMLGTTKPLDEHYSTKWFGDARRSNSDGIGHMPQMTSEYTKTMSKGI